MSGPQAHSVLVTGAGGGLGGETARLFAERGWTTYAADLRPPAAAENLVPVTMDVTDTASVEKGMAEVAGGLGAVVNFAGILGVGPMMELDEERVRRVLEVNVLGTVRVNKAAFPLLREGAGRIVNISSETGWQRAMLLNGPYAMSKHAIEAYSDALRQELMFVGIPVVVVQPGPFRTEMTGGISAAFEAVKVAGSPFERIVGKVGRAASREESKAHDPRELAEVVWRAVTSARPRLRYSVKADPTRRVLHHLPTRTSDWLIRRSMG
jgi:NAD(P)-dependent dehydrogenase (short-subunit alcohol dehydrogenase family)